MRRFHVGPFSLHTTSLPDMAACSSAIPLGYWIGHLVLLLGSVLTCCIGAVPESQAADGVCSQMNRSLGLYQIQSKATVSEQSKRPCTINFNVGMTVTHVAGMKKSMRAIKATLYMVALIALKLFFISAS